MATIIPEIDEIVNFYSAELEETQLYVVVADAVNAGYQLSCKTIDALTLYNRLKYNGGSDGR